MEEVTERFEDADRNGDKLISFDEHVIDTFGEDGVKIRDDTEASVKYMMYYSQVVDLSHLLRYNNFEAWWFFRGKMSMPLCWKKNVNFLSWRTRTRMSR